MNDRFNRTALALMIVGLIVPSAYAQVFSRVEETSSNSTAYFYHVQPGTATVETYVMGTVGAPGLYVIEEGTDLGQLLALAGGPALDPLHRDSRRNIEIRLFRQLSDGPVYAADLGRVVTRPEPYPTLQDGDVLTVEITEMRRFNWRDAFTVIGGLSALAVAIERAVAISR